MLLQVANRKSYLQFYLGNPFGDIEWSIIELFCTFWHLALQLINILVKTSVVKFIS